TADFRRVALRRPGITEARVRLLDLDGRELLSRSYPRAGILRYLDLLTSRGLTFVEEVDGALQLLDVDGKVRARLPGVPEMSTGPVCLSDDGSRLAVTWRNPTNVAVMLYEPNAAKPALTRVSPGCFTWCLAMSPDNRHFASGGEDGAIRIWDSVTGK